MLNPPRRRALVPLAIAGAILCGVALHPHAARVAISAGRSRRAAPIVALGDSLTYGWLDGGGRATPWTAELARRLHRPVINAGIPGNTIAVPDCRRCGAPALRRLYADALSVHGLRTLIVLEGINDILRGGSAPEIIAGLRQIAARAHVRGVRVIAGTLLPYGAYWRYTAAGEQARQAVNRWLRATPLFDGMIDFAALMAAPGNPTRLNAIYDSGDGLHPNARGYRAMGDAIPLSLFSNP